jgi:hypothetical protein
MNKNKSGVIFSLVVGVVAGIAVCFFAPTIRQMLPPLHGVDWAEDSRTTSPDGKFDAVLIQEGLDEKHERPTWYLYLVEKGYRVPLERKYALLHASDLRGQKLMWHSPHLLLFQYDVAEIQHFRNLWDAVESPANHVSGKPEYFVEIRLVPTTPAFSVLTPEGDFR